MALSDAEELQQLRERVASLEQQLTAQQTQLDKEEAELVQLRRLVDQMPSGVIVLDQRGMISAANRAAELLLGVALKGRRWVDVIQACFAPRPDDGHEVSLKNGRRVSVATRAFDGQPGQLLFFSDQTETRNLQQKLHHHQRLSEIGRMMASLAHQIRTPLSAALLYAGHLSSPQLTEEQRIRFAGKMRSRLLHLEGQVRDMLIFAKGEINLENRISTEDLLRQIEEHLDVPLAHADADCGFNNEAAGAVIQCNLELLLGAILNLVNNALDATGNGAQLQMTFAREQHYLSICVEDNGPGMSAEQMRKALEPFYTTKSHGTGLGLAIAQVIARAHHGQFKLDSVLGQGTTARFLIPMLELTPADSIAV